MPMPERRIAVVLTVIGACSVAANGASNWAEVPTEFQLQMVGVAVALAFTPLLWLTSPLQAAVPGRSALADEGPFKKICS